MLEEYEPKLVEKIDSLWEHCSRLSLKYTLTPSSYHLDVLKESISLLKSGYRFMPVVGASASVESCLLAKKRGDKGFDTLSQYFDEGTPLLRLIRTYIEDPLVPIGELLDKDESIIEVAKEHRPRYSPRFVELRNKFAHGDILELTHPPEFYRLLPNSDELLSDYGVIVDVSQIWWNLTGYVQIIKSLRFMIKWLNNLSER